MNTSIDGHNNIKFFIILLLITITSGWFFWNLWQPEEFKIDVEVSPSFLIVTDNNNNAIGRAIPLVSQILVMPDHLIDLEQKLFIQGRPIKILERYFSHDIAFIRSDFEYVSIPSWNKNPIFGLQKVFFTSDDNFTKKYHRLLSFEDLVSLEGETKKNILTFEGIVSPGLSGSPIFDNHAQVVAMVIGTNYNKQKMFAVRADMILSIWQASERNN